MSSIDVTTAAFVRGPDVAPADALLAWLEQQAHGDVPALLRLPVVLARGPLGFSSRRARIGAAADAVVIDVDDGALGIALADRARTCCAGAPTCALWLVGFWRGPRDGALAFAVIQVGEPISPAQLAGPLHAEVSR